MPPVGLDSLLTKAHDLMSFLLPKPISPRGTKGQPIPLLSRLPPELRWLIWDLYFRGYPVHPYVERKERLRAFESFAKHFELVLPFPAADSTLEETLPCTVIRRVEEPRRPLDG